LSKKKREKRNKRSTLVASDDHEGLRSIQDEIFSRSSVAEVPVSLPLLSQKGDEGYQFSGKIQ